MITKSIISLKQKYNDKAKMILEDIYSRYNVVSYAMFDLEGVIFLSITFEIKKGITTALFEMGKKEEVLHSEDFEEISLN